MCGPHSRYRERFDARDAIEFAPRFNVVPSQTGPVVRQDEHGQSRPGSG